MNKNPSKRASIEQLREHSWFKNAPKSDFIVEGLLLKLPEFHERVKIFLQNAASIAAKEMRAPQDAGAFSGPAPSSGSAKVSSPPPGVGTPSSASPAPAGHQPGVVTVASPPPPGQPVAHPQPQHSGVHSLVQPLSPAALAAAAAAATQQPHPPGVQSPPPSASAAPPNTPANYNHAMVATSPPVHYSAPASTVAEAPRLPTSMRHAQSIPTATVPAVSNEAALKPEGTSTAPSPSRRPRLSGGRGHRRKRSETDDIMDQIEQVALEESDGSEGEFEDLENIGEESDESDDESHGSLTENLSHRALGITAPRPSNQMASSAPAETPLTSSSPVPSSFTPTTQLPPGSLHVPVVLGSAQLQPQPAQPTQGAPLTAKLAPPTVAVSPPHLAAPTASRVPTSLTSGLQSSFSMAAVTGAPPARDSANMTPSSTPADTPPDSPTSTPDQWLNQSASAATGALAVGNQLAANPGGEVRGRFRIVNNPAGPAELAGGASLSLAPLAVAQAPLAYDSADALPLQATAMAVISDAHQRPLHNIPLETYIGETEKEFLIFIRTIPGTTVKCRLEGKTLVIAGTLPSLPPIPGVKSVALFEKPHSEFVRRIKFLQEIDPSEPSRDMLREHNTMVIHIKKFPKSLDLCEDTF